MNNIKNKNLTLLLLFISFINYSQNTVTTLDPTNHSRIVTIFAPPAITITGTPTDVTVNNGNDGAINNFLISNATTPFQSEIWKNGGTDITKPTNLTALSAGVYTVSIVDQNGCTSPINPIPTFPINQPEELSVTIQTPSVIACNGGTGTLKAIPSGGYPYGTNVTRSYTYEWYKCDNLLGANPSQIPSEATEEIKDKKAGFYMVIVSDYKTKSKPFIIELKQNPQIIVSDKVITNAKCLGDKGSITLAITGGTGDYIINWLDDSLPTQKNITSKEDKINNVFRSTINEIGGKYYYNITDANVSGCSIKGNLAIKEPDELLVITPTKKKPSTINATDGEIKITSTGGTLPNETINYIYQWSKIGDTNFTGGNINEIKGLSNGTYQVVVTSSSGCIAPTEIIILEALNVKIPDSKIKCFGDTDGSLKAIASGGTLKSTDSKYTFVWKKLVNNTEVDINSNSIVSNDPTTIINLSAGTYRVTIKDDDLKTVSDDYTLTQPDKQLTVTSDKTTQQHHVSCYGQSDGAIEITVDGGTPNYTYTWSNGKTSQSLAGITVGTYSVLVADVNGCKAELNNITITSPTDIIIPEPNIKKVSIFGQNLNDGAITIAPITGGLLENETSTDYNYSWTKDGDTTFKSTDLSPTGLGKGTYHLTVTVIKTGCTKTIDCIVPENDKLTVAIQETASIFCYGTSTGKLHAEINGGFGLYKIAWYKKNEQTNTLEFISNLQDIDKQSAGEYSVKVTDSANPEPAGPFAEAEQLDYKLINQKTLLTVASTAQTDVLCHGEKTGAISLQIEGGTQPYTAVWSNENTTFPAKTNLGKLDTFSSIEAGIYSVTITDAHGCTAILSNPITIIQPTDPLLITDVEVKNLTGFETKNGRIAVTITGGTAPYTYAWRNKGINTIIGDKAQISSLPIGTYELTITDNHNCSVTKEYTLVQPDKLLITAITQTPTSTIKCNGDKFGILVATITGGAPIGVLDADKNYTYKWYNVLTPNVTASTTNPSETLVAGTYALTVTDVENNTFTLQSAPIIEPPLLKIDYTQTNVSCYDGNNGTIAITVTGGTGNHTISWSNGKDTEAINNLRAGIYTVTVTDDNQCQTIENMTITEPELLYVSKVTKNPPSALGLQDGSIEIQVTGGTPNYNYLWYNGNKDLIYSDLNQPSNTSINNIFAGQYFITVTDAKGCAVIEKDLDKIDPLVLSVNQINVVKCNGDATASIKAAASGGTPIYYYKWYKTTDPLNAVGQAATLVNANAGTYYVVLSDSFGLTKQSDNITITEPNVLDNTLTSEYTRCGDANDWTITTAPTGGTAPYTYLWNTGARTASLNDVPPGNYSVLVTDNHGCTITKNVIITAPIHLATAEVITKPTCFEGSDATIVLTSSGGQGPYTYLWNTGEKSNVLSNASAKEYSVAVTDFKGCVINKTYTIENPPKDVINLGEDVTLCFDQSLTINATVPDDKAKYSWISTKGFTSNKPIITVSEPAEYTLTVTNHLGCDATDTLKISKQDTAISAEFAVSSQVFMDEKFIIVDISNPIADSIEWILPTEATVVSKNKDFAELSFNKVGEYELTLNTKKGNCTATQTKKIVVIEGEYVDPDSTDLKKKFDLTIYPNPSNGIFTVDVTLDKVMPAHVKVYNLSNNMIIDSKYEEGKDAYKFNFNLNGLTAGVYFVLVESQQGNQLRKIIIN